MKSIKFNKFMYAGIALLLVVATVLFFALNKDDASDSNNQSSTQQNDERESANTGDAISGVVVLSAWDVSIDLDPSKEITLQQSDRGALVYGPDKANGSRTLCGTITRKEVPNQNQTYEDQNATAYKQLDGWLYSYNTDSATDCPDTVSAEVATSMLFLKSTR